MRSSSCGASPASPRRAAGLDDRIPRARVRAVITPRVTRLLRAPDLRALQQTILSALPAGLDARSVAVLVPTRSAAAELRRTIEETVPGDGCVILPDLLTRADFYRRLHERLPGVAPLLTEFERAVLFRLATGDAQAEGAAAPFQLRPGLLAAMLDFYDEVRRRGRTIDDFDRTARERLEPGSDTDRGAARLLKQTAFLAASFAAFERRVGDSGGVDEHALRSLLLSGAHASRYAHVMVCVADQAADARGLWPADFDLLSRLPGVRQLDVAATESLLAAGFHQRIHDALPGIAEQRLADAGPPPVLLVPETSPAKDRRHFVCRDREEELVAAARWIKQRARTASQTGAGAPALHRTAIVFQRPLPYLYLGRQVLGSACIPHQAVDALPLAAEPYAAAIDLVFTVLSEEATRDSLIGLLGSPCWSFADPAHPGMAVGRPEIEALDASLRDAKYLGGWDRLRQLASDPAARTASRVRGGRHSSPAPAMAAALTVAADLEPIAAAATASDQIGRLLSFVARHERTPREGEPGHEARLRARAAILGALTALRDAHARFDERPLAVEDLVGSMRRWIEAQTFAPRAGRGGVLLLDVPAAAFASVDSARLVGLVEPDWPERSGGNIFYPAALLRDLGWSSESERLAAARARFHDLLVLPHRDVSVSSFTLEDDALVSPSPFLEDLPSAGLIAAEAPEPSAARIFAHEALDRRPIAMAALSDEAGAWAALRLGRTAAADARYHGSIGPLPPERYAVSRVERYLACPFKYYAGHVLRLEEEREDESGLTPQERGLLLHGVFEAFFLAWRGRGGTTITTDTLGDAVALFGEVAERHLLELPEADRALERTYLLGSAASPGLAERAFAFEIEHGVGVIERFVEYPLEGRFQFAGAAGGREISLRGKADRVDLLDDGTLRVVDYKLGRAPKPGRALQLPIYGLCAAQQLSGHRGRAWTLGRVGYVAFREKNPFVELGGRGGNLDDALRDGQQRLLDAVAAIERGEFPPSPDEPWTCTRCGFPHVCRKDYVGDE